LVLDWIYVPTTGISYTFGPWSPAGSTNGGDKTYLIAGNTYYSGTLTFMENCVIKIEPNYYLATCGGVQCLAPCSAPSVITSGGGATSTGDPMYGNTGGGDCTAYEPYAALWLYGIGTNVTLSGLSIRHAQIGVSVYGSCNWGVTHTLAGCRMYMCETGVYMAGENVAVNYSYKCQVTVDYDNTQPQCTSFSGSFVNDCAPPATAYLQGNVEYGMLTLTNGHNNSTNAEYIFNNSAPNVPVSYNTNCWIYGLYGSTAMSVTNDVQNGLNPLQYTCTLITPHHALTVSPFHYTNGGGGPVYFTNRWFGFMDANTNWYVVQCIGHVAVASVGGYAHLGLVAFSNAVPAAIPPVHLLPDDWTNKVPFLNWPNANYDAYGTPCPSTCLPCVGTQQNQFSFPTDLQTWGPNFGTDQVGFHSPSVWLPTNTWSYYHPGLGDSAHPIYVYLPNPNQHELALLAVWETGGPSGTGDLCSPYYVNSAIDALDISIWKQSLGEHVTPVDLDSFPDGTPCNGVDLVNYLGGY